MNRPYVHIYPLSPEAPSHTSPPQSFRSPQSTKLSSPHYTAGSHQLKGWQSESHWNFTGDLTRKWQESYWILNKPFPLPWHHFFLFIMPGWGGEKETSKALLALAFYFYVLFKFYRCFTLKTFSNTLSFVTVIFKLHGWDGWMASQTRWTWVWVNSGSWWWPGRPGVLWFMGSQRVGHDWATDLIWSDLMRTDTYTNAYRV